MNALGEAKNEEHKVKVIAALNNADTSYAFLELLEEYPEKIMRGISIAAKAAGAEEKFLYLPEKKEELGNRLTDLAAKYAIKICYGIVDVRKYKQEILLHITEAADKADIADGIYVPGQYVSVNGERLKKVFPDCRLKDLVPQEGLKAMIAGNTYYLPKEGDTTVEEAKIFDGVIKSLTEKECIVSETEKCLLRFREQSCGKCVFCREGLLQLQYMQKEITEGRGKSAYLELTEEIGTAMCSSALCTLGKKSAKIALSAVTKFSGEYETHIKKKQCPAGVCTSFENIYIDPQLCQGCGECMDICPQDCIEGKMKYIHMIDEFDCTKCGKCIEHCAEGAIQRTSGKLPKLPDRLTKVGKFKKR